MKQLMSLSILAISITTFATTPLKQYAEKPDDALRCDSIIKYDRDGKKYEKTEFTYNEQGNITSKAEYWWRNGVWKENCKKDYTLDAQGYCTGQEYQDLYKQTEEEEICIIDTTIEFVDDSLINEDISDIEFEEEDETPFVEFVEFETDTIRDDQGRICSIIRSQSGEKDSKTDLSYDEQGNITGIYGYDWINDEWVNNSKKEYTYNEQGNITSYIDYWQEDGKLVPWSKSEYIYNEQGQRTNENGYCSKDGEWDLDEKVEYTYDDQGNLDSRLRYGRPRSTTFSSGTDENGNAVSKEYNMIGEMQLTDTQHYYYSKHTIAASEIPFVAGTKYDPYKNDVDLTTTNKDQDMLDNFQSYEHLILF